MKTEVLVAIGLCGFVVALAIETVNYVSKDNSQQMDFICTTDDGITEHHVGVKSAVRKDSSMWKINYIVGAESWYNQPAGELCAVVPSPQDVEISE